MAAEFDFSQIRRDVLTPFEETKKVSWVWLENSWKKASSFLEVLLSYYQSQPGHLYKSSPAYGWDFYHDSVLAHCGKGAVALRIYQNGQWLSITYDELHSLCQALELRWTAQGVLKGETLLLLMEVNLDWWIALLTAWKMGLIPTFLPLRGKGFLLPLLQEIQPQWIYAPRLFAADWESEEGDWQWLSPEESTTAEVSTESGSFVYSEDVTFPFWSPRLPEEQRIFPLSPKDLYLRSLRDGKLLLGLEKGHHVLHLAPSFPDHPSLFLATLLSGATFCEVPFEEVQKNPAILDELPNLHLFLGNHTLSLWQERQYLPKGLLCWYRSPLEGTKWEEWFSFTSFTKERAIPFAHWISDSALGGCLLFSPRRWEMYHYRVLPAPGIPWELQDFSPFPQPARNDIGKWVYLNQDTPFEYCEILLQGVGEGSKEYFLLGVEVPHMKGETFPKAAFQKFFQEKVPEVVYLLPLSDTDPIVYYTYQWTFLVFLGYRSPWTEKEKQEAQNLITYWIQREFGSHFLPSRMEIYPFYPPTTEGQIDEEKCLQWYEMGFLYYRQKQEIFQKLDKIRHLWMKLLTA